MRDEEARPFPFRDGPVPELYTGGSAGEIRWLLLEKVRVFIEEPGYDPILRDLAHLFPGVRYGAERRGMPMRRYTHR